MDLKQHLTETKTRPADFAAQVGVTVQAIYRYLDGSRVPSLKMMGAIQRASGGEVQPADWLAMHEGAQSEGGAR